MQDKTNQQNDPATETHPAASPDERIGGLIRSLETVSSELQAIKESLQKRKSENTTLKILVYTGLIVLVLGSYFTNASLQRAHMESLETSMSRLQSRLNDEMVTFEKNIYTQIDRLDGRIEEIADTKTRGDLERMNGLISRLNPADAATAAKINEVLRRSRELQSLVNEQTKAPAEARGETADPVLTQNGGD